MNNQHTMFVHLHAYINAKHSLQVHNITIANDRVNVRPIQTRIKGVDWPITEHAGWSTLTIRHNKVQRVAQLSQSNRAAEWVSFEWVLGDGVGQTILCTKRCR